MKKKITILLIMSMLLQLFAAVTPVIAEDSSNLKAKPEFVPIMAVVLSPGITTWSTSATVTDHVSGSLIVNVTEEEITTPQMGEVAPTVGSNLIVDYESGADITAGVVTGNYLQLYDVDMDEEGRVAAFYQVKLTAGDIREKDVIKEENAKEENLEDEGIEEEGMTGEVIEKDESAGDMMMLAIEPIPSGETTYNLGPNVTGTLYDDGKLVITGSGAMYNYDSSNTSPFLGNDTITSVIIYDGVTTIGNHAFYGCSALTSIAIQSLVKTIGNYAFYGCSALTSVTIPPTVSSIGDYAFSQCTNLTTAIITNTVTTIGNYAFYGCTALTSVAIPPSVTTIGNYAFSSCSALTSIVIPSSVMKIGSYAFSSCSVLTSVTIRPSVNNIGEGAFQYCSSLTSITLPASVMHIGYFAFSACSKLTSIEIHKSNPNYSSEDGVLFDKNKSILIQYPIGNTRTSYTIPSSVTYIRYCGFEGCTYLTSVTVPESVKAIEGKAFFGCANLTSTIFDNYFKPERIEMKAFEGCTSLTTVTIPDTVKNIGGNAFSGCSSLTTIINQHKGNQIIGVNAFNTNAPNPKTATAYSSNANFINAATTAGYTIKYLDTYTVTFNSNGGTEVPDTTEVPYNTVITAPTPPTRIGYTFGGWYKEAGLTNPWNFETDTVTKDTELYAKWDACFTSNPTNPKKSSSGKRKTAPPQPAQVSVIVIVNGEEHDAGIETKTTEDEKSTVIIELNNQVIKSVIDETTKDNFTGTGSVIQIPITDASSQVAKVELTGDIVKKLEENSFDVSIKRDNVEYIIPAEEFTISNVAENLGVPEKDLKDIKVEVKIARIDETVVASYNEVVKANGAELISPLLEFKIAAKTIKSDDPTGEVEISKFSNYVERIMEIPAGVDPSKITTGVVFNLDGTYSHVPTEVCQKDGKWYAKLDSLTNSTYSVIWNPVTAASVENHWAKEAVNDMASRLVIFAPETFEPNKAITRGDLAEYIVRALGLYRDGSKYENRFTDVKSTGARTEAILIANEYGIISGYPDGTFRAGRQITREEAMVLYQKAMKVMKLTGSDKDRHQNYTDFAEVRSWAEASVKEVLSAQVFNGTTSTTISPKSNLTYAEAAQAIKNLLVKSKLINQ